MDLLLVHFCNFEVFHQICMIMVTMHYTTVMPTCSTKFLGVSKWIAKNQCNAYHRWFLHLTTLLVDIKGDSFLVKSVSPTSDRSQDEPNHPCRCFPCWRCVSCLLFYIVCHIILKLTFRLSADDVTRKPKLFFVSTSATTSTLQTASVCYVSSSTLATCSGRKRRTISLDGMEPAGAVQPSTYKGEVEGESVASSKVGESREGRFLLYWITTTSISTSTSFTTTFSVSSALCTPAGAGICG